MATPPPPHPPPPFHSSLFEIPHFWIFLMILSLMKYGLNTKINSWEEVISWCLEAFKTTLHAFFLLLIKSSAYSSPFYRQHPSSIRISPCGLFTLGLTSSSDGALSTVARLETSGGPFFANPGVVWEGLSNVIIEVPSGDSKKMKIRYCLFQ